MSGPKAPKESADQRDARLAEEKRIKLMQQRADAEEAAAGRSILARKTRQMMRIFGAPIATGSIGLTPSTSGVIAPLGPGLSAALGSGFKTGSPGAVYRGGIPN
ncbi:MAG: hypothetical protein E6R03_12165 [Hyphomicrobiaceae bacterium]|nr:MAG: hypothetical protein E6R03_12165 [Hyphomicrobiaceae bacterium]